jgi:ElaB/YqjD/DUF883 family membrane-anchored ribosome-binding protein
MTERTSASAGSAWDADVLPSDPVEPYDTDSTTAPTASGAYDAVTRGEYRDAGGEEDEVEVLVAEIAGTRSELAVTVEELGERLDPSNIADMAKDRVKEATIGNIETKVNDVTTAASDFASDASRTAQEAGSGLVETIKQNPIPAAMAGIGIGWLLMNRRSGTSSNWSGSWSGDRYRAGSWDSRAIPSGHRMSGGGIGDKASELGDKASELGDRAAEIPNQIGRRAEDASQAVGEAVSNFGDSASQKASMVQQSAGDVVSQAQRAIESNPLAFGAIAVAVGAAVGLALPSTDAEKRVMGQAGSQVIDKVQTAVSKPLERLESQAAQ